MRDARLLATSALVALCLLLPSSEPASAHAVSVGQSKISEVGGVVRYELAVNYDELAERARLETPATRRPGARAATDTQREVALRRAKPRLQSYLGARVRVLQDGSECADTLRTVEVVRHLGEVFAVLSSTYDCSESDGGSFGVRYELFFDAASAARQHAHANVADYELGDKTGRVVFEPANRVLEPGARRARPDRGR